MSNHTPTPWHTIEGTGYVVAESPDPTVGMYYTAYCEAEHVPPATMRANAERIAACVNACEGMADPIAEVAALRADLEEAERLLDDAQASLPTHAGIDIRAFLKR